MADRITIRADREFLANKFVGFVLNVYKNGFRVEHIHNLSLDEVNTKRKEMKDKYKCVNHRLWNCGNEPGCRCNCHNGGVR